MKKFNLFKIILFLFICFSTLGCYHLNNIETNTVEITNSVDSISNYENVLGAGMYNAFEKYFSVVQFDSICKADKISNNLNTWYLFSSIDGETKEVVVEYMYIKNKLNQEIIYRLIPSKDGRYHITKRIRNR